MLVDAYTAPHAPLVLYQLLKERPAEASISHRKMPTWDEHVAFFRARPYQAWYLIDAGDNPVLRLTVGSVYVTWRKEVGLFLFAACRGQGYGSQALDLIRKKFEGTLYANIAPANEASRRFFERHGFRHIQNTFESADV